MNKYIDSKILNNYCFGERIKNIIKIENDIEEKIALIEYLAHFYAVQVTGKYSDYFLEQELLKISNQIIKYTDNNIIKKGTVLHVMTEGFSTGGHTRVVNNWINLDKNRENSVIFTNQTSYAQVPQFLKESVKKSGGKIYFTTKKTKVNRAKYLQTIASGFDKIILHVHMYDSIPILAFGNRNWNNPIYFYGHADFRFWLGVSIADIVLDLYSDSRNRTIMLRNAQNSIVFSIPNMIEEVNNKCSINKTKFLKKYNIPQNAKIITTIGSDYKYTITKQLNFHNFIKNIINKYSDVYVIVIGVNSKSKIWKNTMRITKNRVLALDRLDKNKVDQWLDITDVYLDSFPVGGGVAVLDALNKNIRILSLAIKGDRLDELNEIKSSSLEDLEDKLEKYLIESENSDYKNSYSNIKARFGNQQWIKKLNWLYEIDLKHEVHSFKSIKCCSNFERIYYQVFDSEYKYNKLESFDKLSIENKMRIIIEHFISERMFIFRKIKIK